MADSDKRARDYRQYNARFTSALVTLAALLVAGLLTWGSWEWTDVRSRASAEPMDISVAELASRGPGDNAHVRLRELKWSEHAAYEVDHGQVVGRTKDEFQGVWLVAIPKDSTATDQIIIFTTSDISNRADLGTWKNEGTAVGFAHRGIANPKARQALGWQLPGADLDNVWEVKDRFFPSQAMLFAMYIAAVTAWSASLWCLARMIRSIRPGSTRVEANLTGKTGVASTLPAITPP